MSISDILDDIQEYTQYTNKTPEFVKKYFHKIPPTVSVDRVELLLELCKDKKVLHLGCSGPLHGLISKVAKEAWGIDRVDVDTPNFIKMDLEKDPLIALDGVEFDVVLCAEILEHLSNPGAVLDKLKTINAGIMVVTVPNCISQIGIDWLNKGIENVNDEHVCYYSYKTASNLLSRHGWEIIRWFWYNGLPMFAEGLIFIVRGKQDGDI